MGKMNILIGICENDVSSQKIECELWLFCAAGEQLKCPDHLKTGIFLLEWLIQGRFY